MHGPCRNEPECSPPSFPCLARYRFLPLLPALSLVEGLAVAALVLVLLAPNRAVGNEVGDNDGDGMPDAWELAHGLNPNDPSDAALDPDLDGFPNLAEYRLDTDPQDPASRGTLAEDPSKILFWWPLASNAVASIGGGSGDLRNGATFLNGALSLDGTDDFVSFGNSFSATGSLSYAVWIRPDDDRGMMRLLGKYVNQKNQREWCAFFTGHNILWVFFSDDGSSDDGHAILKAAPADLLPAGQWSHIAVACESGLGADGVRIWLNGQEQALSTVSEADLGHLYAGGSDFTLGAYDVTRETGKSSKEKVQQPFDGLMTQLILGDRALTPTEAKELYELGRTGDLLAYLSLDFDHDGIPDWWERTYFGDVSRPAPETTATVTPPANEHGWHNGDAAIALSVDPILEGLATTYYRVDAGPAVQGAHVEVRQEGVYSVSCWSVFQVGDGTYTEPAKTTSVKLDKTAPEVAGTVAGTPGSNGWWRSQVRVSYEAEDLLSGIDPAKGDLTDDLLGEGAGQTATAEAYDNAGNRCVFESVPANVDWTPPALAVSVTPPANAYGWHKTDVMVTFTAQDPLSGLALVSGPVAVTNEGAGQEIVGLALDEAGNISTQVVTVSLDKTAPEILSFSPANGGTAENPRPTLQAVFRDALSGIRAGVAVLIVDGTNVTTSAVSTATNILYVPPVDLAEGEHRMTLYLADQAYNVVSATAAFSVDTDGLPDEWELRFFTNSAALPGDDPDQDGVSNLQEFQLGTDPACADTDRDNVPDGGDSNAVSRAYIEWGSPSFTVGDDYVYPMPPWVIRAYRDGGQWDTWHVSADEELGFGSLYIELDRAILTTDVILQIDFFDYPGSSLFIDLLNADHEPIVEDLFGNVMTGTDLAVTRSFDIPLSAYPQATAIRIRRGVGEISITGTVLYIDQDHDGLDLAQEAQLGTSDLSADSDGDGVPDGEETTAGTDPTDPGAHGPRTLHVSPAGSHEPPFVTWATAAHDIQSAIDVAEAGDTVLVAAGQYRLAASVPMGKATNVVTVLKPLTLQSVDGPGTTLIVAPGLFQRQTRGVYLGAGALLAGFTVTNARMDMFDGSASWGQPNGGGVWAESGAVVSNCVLVGNRAAWYGGGQYGGLAVDCVLESNRAEMGGAGAMGATLRNCRVALNVTEMNGGGGLFFSTAENCAIVSNRSVNYYGGGSGYSTLRGCVVASNNAGGDGGGAFGGSVESCTIVGNTAVRGGGVAELSAIDSIVYFNTAVAPGTANYVDCVATYSCTTPNPGGIGNITAEPQFVDRQNGDYRLRETSPCVNAGINYDWMVSAVDLDGNPRILDTTVDIGAHEYQCPPVHYVNVNNAFPAYPYATWATAARDIQSAIDAAAAGDTVLVAAGEYRLTGSAPMGKATNVVTVLKPLTLQSVDGPGTTLIVAPGFLQRQTRGVYLGAGALLAGFTVTNARMDMFDGSASWGQPNGGGVWAESGAVVSNCVLVGNRAAWYGGGQYGGLAIDCVLESNRAEMGGAGAMGATLRNCRVALNVTEMNGGGGLFSATAENCVIVSNRSVNYHGGGSGGSILRGCVVAFNNAGGDGGGAFGGSVESCTIVGNTAVRGGGVAELSAIDSIVYFNTAAAPGTANHADCVATYSSTTPDPGGTGNITAEPRFVDWEKGDVHLRGNSPCIDAGFDQPWMAGAKDLDGEARIMGSRADIGVDEVARPDTDGDELPDDWEIEHFGDLSQNGFGDPNNDGRCNWEEYRLGRDPSSPVLPKQQIAGEIMSWSLVPSIPARDYEGSEGQVLYSEDIVMPLDTIDQWDKLCVVATRDYSEAGWCSVGLSLRVRNFAVPANALRGLSVGATSRGASVHVELIYTGGGRVELTSPLYLLKWSPRVSF